MGSELMFCWHHERCCPLDACLERCKDRRVLNVRRASTLNPHVLATLYSRVARSIRLKWDVKSTFRAHVSLQCFSELCKNIHVPAMAVWDLAVPATPLQTLMELVCPINSLLPNPGDVGGYFLLWKGPINNLKPLTFLLRPPGCGDAGKHFLFWERPSFSQLLLWYMLCKYKNEQYKKYSKSCQNTRLQPEKS
jgi:hypothetical protein